MFFKVIAHRGSSAEAPENTLCAFELALLQGAEGLELDVQLTRDGEPIVLHDETLDRTTSGTGYVAGWTYEEVRRLDAGGWFGSQFIGEKIPHLKDVLDLVSHKEILLNIELKNGLVPYSGLEAKVLNLLARYPEQKVVISSFNHYSMRTIKSLSSATKVGLLYMAGMVEPWRYADFMSAYSLHPFYLNIIPELVTGCQQVGIALFPWTVDSTEDAERIGSMGVEGIITNKPGELAALKKESTK